MPDDFRTNLVMPPFSPNRVRPFFFCSPRTVTPPRPLRLIPAMAMGVGTSISDTENLSLGMASICPIVSRCNTNGTSAFGRNAVRPANVTLVPCMRDNERPPAGPNVIPFMSFLAFFRGKITHKNWYVDTQ